MSHARFELSSTLVMRPFLTSMALRPHSNNDIKLPDFWGGDGIDVSGSTLSVKRVALRNIADKAISVGEASTIALDASRIADVGIAVASKDGSVANVTGLRVARASKVAFAAYRKKPEYPHAALDASDSTISETAATVLGITFSWALLVLF